MAITIDRVISQYDLLDRYTSKLEAMSRKTRSFQAGVEMAVGAVKTLALTATGALAVAVLKVGVDAVQASAQFEQFAVTLEVLAGSSDAAAKKLDFIRRLAIPSTFTFQQLAEAGTQLESFRIPLEKALPLIAKLGAAFPNKELGDFVNLFGRLGAGDFPDIEALSGAGLSKLDFVRKGIKFDANGSLLSSSRDTMDALEKVINERYGNILDRIASTTNAKLSTIKDKWEQILRKIGDALAKFVSPALDKLSKWLDDIGKDRNFEKFLQNIGKNFVKFVGIIFGVLGSLLGVLALVKLAFRDFFGAFVLGLASLASFAGGMAAVTKLGKLFNDLQVAGQQGNLPAQVPGAPPGMEFPDNPALATLNDIKSNTRQTADNTRQALDLRKFALGGGDIGALGVTPIERFAGRGGSHRSVNVQVQGRDKLAAAIQEIVHDVVEQLEIRRAGR